MRKRKIETFVRIDLFSPRAEHLTSHQIDIYLNRRGNKPSPLKNVAIGKMPMALGWIVMLVIMLKKPE